MTQEQLAGEEYTKAFVSAVEREESGISDQALEIFARRLEVPVERFRVSQRSFDVTISDVERLLYQGQPEQALQRLEDLVEMGTLPRSQWPLLRRWMGQAYLALNQATEALNVLLQALSDYESLDDAVQVERTRLLLGTAHYLRGNLGEAVQAHQLCLKAIKDGVITEPSFAVRVYSSLGNEHVALGNFDLALVHYEDALRVAEDAQDLDRLAASHWGMSIIYKEHGDLEAALVHARRALALYEVLGNRRLAGQIQNNMGIVHAEMGSWERARQCYEQTLQASDAVNDVPARAQALLNLVEYYSATGQTATAIALLPQALDIAQSTGQPYYYVGALLRASTTQQAAGALVLAADYALQAMSLATEHDLRKKFADACFRYASVLAAQGRADDAVPYFGKAYAAARGAPQPPALLR
jgi:tetratricopeptide (TPR) repeat protein